MIYESKLYLLTPYSIVLYYLLYTINEKRDQIKTQKLQKKNFNKEAISFNSFKNLNR